jgi:hypothetical protein
MHAQGAWVATGDNKGRVQKINVDAKILRVAGSPRFPIPNARSLSVIAVVIMIVIVTPVPVALLIFLRQMAVVAMRGAMIFDDTGCNRPFHCRSSDGNRCDRHRSNGGRNRRSPWPAKSPP